MTSLADVQLNGAYSRCVPPFFKSEKVNGQRFETVVLFGSQLRVLDANLVSPLPVVSPRAFNMAASSM